MKYSYYLDRPSADRTFVVMSVSMNGWNLKVSTKIYLKPSDVNLAKNSKTRINSIKTGRGAGKNEKGEILPGYEARKQAIEEKLNKFINADNNGGLDLTKEQVRQELQRIISPDKFSRNTMLLEIYREYLDGYKTKEVSSDTIVTKRSMYRQLENYLKSIAKTADYDIPIEEFNTRKFLEQFVQYLRNLQVQTKRSGTKKLSVNYIKKIITDLRSFGRWAADSERKYIDELVGTIEVKSEESIKVALNYQEIDLIYNFESTKLRLNEIRDTFVLQCLTGLRYSDLKQLTDRNSKTARFDASTNTIRLTTKKTDTDIVIPIQPRLQALFDRRNKEANLTISELLHTFTVPDLFNYNKSLKRLCKEAGITGTAEYKNHTAGERELKEKWELVFSHTARRSYITNLMRAGLPDEFIRLTTGHEKLDSFRKYIKLEAEDLKNIFEKLL